MRCKSTSCRAQAGIVEFLILVFLMIFLAGQALVLAGEAKKNGLLLLERAVIDRSLDRIDFVLTELNATGAGKRTIILEPKPFITYSARCNNTSIILFAYSQSANYNSSITADLNPNSDCDIDQKESIKIVMQKWDKNKIEVNCTENPV